MSSSNEDNRVRLPFYKAPQPKTNQYQFAKEDFQNIPVIQQRFIKRTPPNRPQVTEAGLANQAGIKLGDTVVNINGADTINMSLAEAHQRIDNAGENLKMSVKNFEDDDGNKVEEKEIDLGAQKRLEKDDRSNWIAQPERKVWHPIVWQQPPPPIPPEMIGKDAPHKRIINNIYRFFRENEKNPEFRQKHIEDMLLALPTASKQF